MWRHLAPPAVQLDPEQRHELMLQCAKQGQVAVHTRQHSEQWQASGNGAHVVVLVIESTHTDTEHRKEQ